MSRRARHRKAILDPAEQPVAHFAIGVEDLLAAAAIAAVGSMVGQYSASIAWVRVISSAW